MYKTRNTGTGNGMLETRGRRGGYIPGILRSIPGNVTKYSGKYPQTFRRISSNILRGCSQKFWKISPNIPRNVAYNSWKCRQTFRGMSSNTDCWLQMMLSKCKLSKSTVGCLSLGRSFINLCHCLQSI